MRRLGRQFTTRGVMQNTHPRQLHPDFALHNRGIIVPHHPPLTRHLIVSKPTIPYLSSPPLPSSPSSIQHIHPNPLKSHHSNPSIYPHHHPSPHQHQHHQSAQLNKQQPSRKIGIKIARIHYISRHASLPCKRVFALPGDLRPPFLISGRQYTWS